MPDPSYWRDYRAAHPAYRARERERKRRAREARGREDRRAEYARRNAHRRAIRTAELDAEQEGWRLDHPILDHARAVASRHVRPDRRSQLGLTHFDDAVGVAALAIVAGEDPADAVRGFLRAERSWMVLHPPLLLE